MAYPSTPLLDRGVIVGQIEAISKVQEQVGEEATVYATTRQLRQMYETMLQVVDAVNEIKQMGLIRDSTYKATLDGQSQITLQVHD